MNQHWPFQGPLSTTSFALALSLSHSRFVRGAARVRACDPRPRPRPKPANSAPVPRSEAHDPSLTRTSSGLAESPGLARPGGLEAASRRSRCPHAGLRSLTAMLRSIDSVRSMDSNTSLILSSFPPSLDLHIQCLACDFPRSRESETNLEAKKRTWFRFESKFVSLHFRL